MSENTEQKPQVVDNIQEVGQAEPTFISSGPVDVMPKPPDSLQFSPSSNPNKPIGMDFSSAIQQVLEGKPVTRLAWGNPEIYLIMFMWGQVNPKTPAGKYLSIHHADGAVNPLYISDGDLAGDDWVVVV